MDSPGPSHSSSNTHPIKSTNFVGARSRRSPTRNSSTTSKEDARTKSRSRSAGRATKEEYTSEEKIQVERIRHCKDYYEILQINKTEFTEILLKKKYRELALKLHPDKCKAPGSTEAFKGKQPNI